MFIKLLKEWYTRDRCGLNDHSWNYSENNTIRTCKICDKTQLFYPSIKDKENTPYNADDFFDYD